MTVAGFFGRNRARLTRVWGLSGMIMGVVNALTFAIVQKSVTGFSIPVMVVLVLAVVVGLPALFVWYEERSGTWGEESLHIWKLAGWDPKKLSEDIAEIKERLK